MRVRIVKRATQTIDGVSLTKFVPGGVYDVSPGLADYLVLEGLARPEMRRPVRAKLKKRVDRRQRRS
jgi:hypothetical protein